MRPVLALRLLVLCGCAGLESLDAHRYGYGPGAGCSSDDGICAEVEGHLDAIRHEWGGWCGTVWHDHVAALTRMGALAFPTLRRELGAESRIHARFAALVLIRGGRAADVITWCAAHPGGDNHDVVCEQ